MCCSPPIFKPNLGRREIYLLVPLPWKKSLEVMSFLVLSVFAPFFLEFHLIKVSIEIQGLSTIDCNFQGLSRPWIFMLKFKDFQGVCELTLWFSTNFSNKLCFDFSYANIKKMLLVAVGIHSFLKITFTWLEHFLWQYLHLHGGKNTMLLHLLLIAKLQNKTRYHKNIKSLFYYIAKRYFAIAFVFTSLLTLDLF